MIVIFAAMISGDSWVQLALLTVAIVLIGAMKGAIRTAAINELLPEWRSQLQQWSWVWTALAPVVPFLFAWNFLNSLVTKRNMVARGRYELVSPSLTRILMVKYVWRVTEQPSYSLR